MPRLMPHELGRLTMKQLLCLSLEKAPGSDTSAKTLGAFMRQVEAENKTLLAWQGKLETETESADGVEAR